MGTTVQTKEPERLVRRVGIAVVLGFGVLFVVQNHRELPAAWRSMRGASPIWLVVLTVGALSWLVNYALLHAAAQRAAGMESGPLDLLAPAIGGNALNLVTKSGGMAGLSLFLADARRRGRSKGTVAAAYALAQVIGEMAFAVTLLAAIVLVWVDGRLSRAELIASAVFVVYLAIRVTVLVAAFRSRSLVRHMFTIPGRLRARLRRRSIERVEEPIDTSVPDELHDAMVLLRRHPRRVIPILMHALAVEGIGVIEVWAAASAVGADRSLVVALIGYSVSVLFAIVGFLPGGLGFVEVSLGAVFTSFGASVAQATAAVVLYRVAELWLPVATGLVTVHFLRRHPTDTTDVVPS